MADGAWSWFQDPRAIHYVGGRNRTYIGYVTSAGDVDIVSQDAGTAVLAHTTLHAGLQADDHAAPGLAILPGGRIIVFYSQHGGAKMLYRISQYREDIRAFGPEHSVPTNTGTSGVYSYGNPVYLSAEHRLYLFFRGGDSRPAMTWTTDYVHWARAVDVVIPDHEPGYTRPYVKYTSNGVDTIRFAFTDGHPREVRTNSLYSMSYKAGVLSAPDGTPTHRARPDRHRRRAYRSLQVFRIQVRCTPIGSDPVRPIPQATAASSTTAPPRPVPHGSRASPSPRTHTPAIVYSTYGNLADAKYRYARWNGTGWTKSLIVSAGGSIDISPDEPQYSGGADLDHNDPATVYVSRETSPGSRDWEVARWHTADGGATWGAPTAVTQHSSVKNIRPVAPTGPPGEIRVVWMSGRYTGYRLGGYNTQLREWTTGLAPTSARISEIGAHDKGRIAGRRSADASCRATKDGPSRTQSSN